LWLPVKGDGKVVYVPIVADYDAKEIDTLVPL
jgi:hypothetical protein